MWESDSFCGPGVRSLTAQQNRFHPPRRLSQKIPSSQHASKPLKSLLPNNLRGTRRHSTRSLTQYRVHCALSLWSVNPFHCSYYFGFSLMIPHETTYGAASIRRTHRMRLFLDLAVGLEIIILEVEIKSVLPHSALFTLRINRLREHVRTLTTLIYLFELQISRQCFSLKSKARSAFNHPSARRQLQISRENERSKREEINVSHVWVGIRKTRLQK